jgi:nicotinate-nucleotide adenylyltransferase
MGSDNLLQIPHWRSWQDIFRLVPVAVVTRPKTALEARFSKAATRFKADLRPADRHLPVTRPPAWTVIEGRRDPSSATELRAASYSRP